LKFQAVVDKTAKDAGGYFCVSPLTLTHFGTLQKLDVKIPFNIQMINVSFQSPEVLSNNVLPKK